MEGDPWRQLYRTFAQSYNKVAQRRAGKSPIMPEPPGEHSHYLFCFIYRQNANPFGCLGGSLVATFSSFGVFLRQC